MKPEPPSSVIIRIGEGKKDGLMQKIVEKLGFMKVRTVKVCTKTGILSCTGLKKYGISSEFAEKLLRKKKTLIV